MSALLCLGRCINRQVHGSSGFDAFAANKSEGLFTLSDGANSCPTGGDAARWLVDRMTLPEVPRHAQALSLHLHEQHLRMLTLHPESAATLLHAQIDFAGVRLATVGDSVLHVLKRSWGVWRAELTMPLDLDAHGQPSQLMGSEVMRHVHLRELPAQGPVLIVMMSDGAAHHLGLEAVRTLLSSIGRQRPSDHDLDYLCQKMVAQAIALGATDDTSVAVIWVNWP